ncbi:MAG: DUF350 domain-containing protein [Arenicella sp.]|nr:DUF350 domain-containing protein [Arenicella sp.]
MELNQFYTLAVNILIIIAFVLPVRFILAKYLGVNAKQELDKSDNAAFGVSIAGGALGLILMLTGVMSGESMAVISEEIMSLIVYGILGYAMMMAGVLIQDKLVIRGVSLAKEISNGNMAAAIVVATNMAIVGLIAKKTITWIDSDGLDGIVPILVVFAVSQLVLAVVVIIRSAIYSMRNAKNSEKGFDVASTWPQAIASGNTAIALRYAGQLLATGIVISATSVVVDGDSSTLAAIALTWLGTALGLTILVWVGYRIFLPIVLFKVNVVEEVDHQNNIGVAAVEAALFVGLAFMATAYIA